jgi:predicted nucleic acid-binding protein
MNIFMDTSAVYALLDRDDANHKKADSAWTDILSGDHTLLTTNYVLVESFALLQNRLGTEAVRTFHEDIVPIIGIEWINDRTHGAAVSALLAASKRRLSLVDCASFEVMRSFGVKKAFAFDPHFSEYGFALIP